MEAPEFVFPDRAADSTASYLSAFFHDRSCPVGAAWLSWCLLVRKMSVSPRAEGHTFLWPLIGSGESQCQFLPGIARFTWCCQRKCLLIQWAGCQGRIILSELPSVLHWGQIILALGHLLGPTGRYRITVVLSLQSWGPNPRHPPLSTSQSPLGYLWIIF